MRLSKTTLHPYSKNRFYIPCTFELRTYDAMLTISIHHIEWSVEVGANGARWRPVPERNRKIGKTGGKNFLNS